MLQQGVIHMQPLQQSTGLGKAIHSKNAAQVTFTTLNRTVQRGTQWCSGSKCLKAKKKTHVKSDNQPSIHTIT